MAALASPRRWPALAAAFLVANPLGAALGDGSADFFVRDLPGAPKDVPLVKMHAGHIEIDPEHNGNLFFWHFANQHIAQRQRTVIWLNGGPGCSSEDGALMEIGPYRLKDENNLVMNEGSWHEFANLLFVDNPVGTGFSYVDTNAYVTELDEMASQFMTFLENWFNLFPQYADDDIYIAGESFAGQHIPYIAREILKRNKTPGTRTPWNLKGLVIGNGWISPYEQYDAYLKFAYEKGLIDKGSDISNKLQDQWRACKDTMAGGDAHVDYGTCEKILQDFLRYTSTEEGGKTMCYNMYDVRLKDTYSSCGMNWPPDLDYVTPYLRKNDVVAALHVNPAKKTGWKECTGAVSSAFRSAHSKPSIELLPELIEEVPILLFSGAEDLICNHVGTEALIANMEWNGGKGFEISPGNWAPRRDWTFEGENAGFWQEARNLTYVLFNNASHMVPFDLPRRSRDMLDRFMGVDVSSIGGEPTDSRLDGEKGTPTTVGDAKQDANNATAADEQEKQLQEAKWHAYQRSGEVVLVIVAIAAGAWGLYIWRSRRKSREGYLGLSTGPADGGMGRGGPNRTGLEGFRRRGGRGRDVEAGDFDESELDDLHVATPTEQDTRYSVGGDSDEEEEEKRRMQKTPQPGVANGSRTLT